MKKRMSWYWAAPGAVGLALVMAAVLLLVATAGHTPTASAQAGCTLTVTKAADVGIAPIGGPVVYTLTVHNTSAVACTGITVTDVLADHMDCTATTQATGWTAANCAGAAGVDVTWTAATLAASASATLTLTATVTGAANEEVIPNSATIVAAAGSEGTGSAVINVTVNDCDLAISKDADPDDEVGEGGSIVYTIDVENEGTVDCANVVITEDIPDGTDCTATDVVDEDDAAVADAEGCDTGGNVTWDVTEGALNGLGPGDKVEVEMTVKLEDDTEDGDEVVNEACVASDDTDPDTDVCDTMTIDVSGVAATKTPTPGPTATATVRPVVPTIQAPPPVAAPLPTLSPPVTGTGSDGDSSRPLAIGLGLAGMVLLLVSGATLVKRTR